MARIIAALLLPRGPGPACLGLVAGLQMAAGLAVTPGPRPTAANAEISPHKETAPRTRTKSANEDIGKNE